MRKLISSLSLISLFFLYSVIAHSSEEDLYSFSWLDKDKEVYVLQNRKYRKDKNFYLSGGGGVTTSGAFVNAFSLQTKAGYFFKEDWGLEFLFAKNFGKENDIAELVKNPNGVAGSVPFRVFVKSYVGGQVLWSPFYSKINTFNKIIYVDWMFGLGGGWLTESNNRNITSSNTNDFGQGNRSISDDSQDLTDSHFAFLWSTGFQIYLNKDLYLKVDMVATHFKTITESTSGKTIMYNNYDVGLNFGYIF